jgi:hypothetical protein
MNSRKRSGEKDGDYSLVWFVLGCFFRAQEASVDLLGFCLDCSNLELTLQRAGLRSFFFWQPEDGRVPKKK